MREVINKVYKLEELDENIQQTVLCNFSDINIDDSWWCESIYDDAEQVGITINAFDLASNMLSLDCNVHHAATEIMMNHGDPCATFQLAKDRLDNQITDDQFLTGIAKAYLAMLQDEYNYQTSNKAITETLEANEYEFYANGRVFKEDLES